MNTDLVVAWAEALESGEYEQGMYALKTATGKMCCLGVLCDVAMKRGDIHGEWTLIASDQYAMEFTQYEDAGHTAPVYASASYLSPTLQELTGLESAMGAPPPRRRGEGWFSRMWDVPQPDDPDFQVEALSVANDGGYADFPTIAKLIRTQLLKEVSS